MEKEKSMAYTQNNGRGERIMVEGEKPTTQGRKVQQKGNNNNRRERAMEKGKV